MKTFDNVQIKLYFKRLDDNFQQFTYAHRLLPEGKTNCTLYA